MKKYHSEESTRIEIANPTTAEAITSLAPIMQRLLALKAEDIEGICCSVIWRQEAGQAKGESGFVVLGGLLPALKGAAGALVDKLIEELE